MSEGLTFGVIGREIAYSRSADIFKAAMTTLDVPAACELISIEEDHLAETLNLIRSGKYVGCSITIPYKAAVIPMLDQLDKQAEQIQAVNSICMKEGRLTGYNTDLFGFAYPLAQRKQTIQNALVLGCGGSARAVAYSLSELLDCSQIVVAGRSTEKLSAFNRQFDKAGLKAELMTTVYDQPRPHDLNQIGIVVNCTPLGGWNLPDQNPLPDWLAWSDTGSYYDLNYNQNNLVIESARAASVECISGSRMLVAQALKSLELWTGHAVPFESVYDNVFPEEV